MQLIKIHTKVQNNLETVYVNPEHIVMIHRVLVDSDINDYAGVPIKVEKLGLMLVGGASLVIEETVEDLLRLEDDDDTDFSAVLVKR